MGLFMIVIMNVSFNVEVVAENNYSGLNKKRLILYAICITILKFYKFINKLNFNNNKENLNFVLILHIYLK